MKVALIAHDQKKMDMIVFAKDFEQVLANQELYATGTTGQKVMENTQLKITCMKSGPLGGDQEMGAMIANGNMDMVFFFRDPLTAQPHEPDVSALMRLCDVYEIPIATNRVSARFFIDSI